MRVGELQNLRCGTVGSDGVRCGHSERILPWNESTWSFISNCNPSMGKVVTWRRLCRVWKATWSTVLSSHTRGHFPERWLPSAAVPGDMQVITLKREAFLTGVFGASCIVAWIFTHTNCKLCIFEWPVQRGTPTILSSFSGNTYLFHDAESFLRS